MVFALVLTLSSIAATPTKAERLEDYANRHLVFRTQDVYSIEDNLTYSSSTSSTWTTSVKKSTYWWVEDAWSNHLTTEAFATAVGDTELLADLQADLVKGKKTGIGLIAIGAPAFGVGAIGSLASRTADNPSTALIMGSALVMTAGGLVGGYGYYTIKGAKAPLENVTLAYSASMAKQKCETFNEGLRTELKLTAEDTRIIDTAVTELDEEDLELGAAYGNPEPLRTGSGIEAQPMVGFGFIGAQGRF